MTPPRLISPQGVAQNIDVLALREQVRMLRLGSAQGQVGVSGLSGTIQTPARGFRTPGYRKASSVTTAQANLILTKTKPRGYADPPADTLNPVYVTWGSVNSRPPSNVGLYTIAEHGKKVWIKATTNGSPDPLLFKVTELVIESAVGDVPEDTGATATTPPITCYFLIGEISVVSGAVSVNTRAGGDLRLQLTEVGSACFGPSDTYPTGGSQTTYQIEWVASP